MDKVIYYHGAGGFSAPASDKAHSHRIVDGDGKRHSGTHAISANALGISMRSQAYAGHTRGLITGMFHRRPDPTLPGLGRLAKQA